MPTVAVEPEQSLQAAPAIDFVCRNEYEFTIQELANGADWSTIKGLSYRDKDGKIVNNPEREILMDMDKLPSVLPVYKQLKVENYFGGYLKHPYMSWYTGRGCKSRCTFCLWPQTIGGHKYRYQSTERVIEDVKYLKKEFPQVKEIFFDDDTLTDDHARVEALAVELGKLGVAWSCNAKANVPRKTLEVMKANGLRLPVGRLRIRQSSRFCTTSKRACSSRLPSVSRRIATSSASSCTAPSFLVCQAKRRRRSRKRWPLPRK